MIYVALLRGINVGGKNKVEMSRLKATFEALGHTNVVTYINSGNIIFASPELDIPKLEHEIEKGIENDFGFSIRVVIRSQDNIAAVDAAIPKSWINNQDMKTDVMFLWEEVDNKSVLENLKIKPDIEDVKYIKGAIVWRVDRSNATKSGLLKIIGTPLYKQMTIRNINTLRKLHALMN